MRNKLDKPLKSGKISVDHTLCSGCSICELACSLYHEGICSPELSRVHIEKKFLELDFTPQVCIQCDWPSCYYECPQKAIKLDDKTGARYIDKNICTGCGRCVKVCPLIPDKKIISFKKTDKKKTYFKCDLCMERKEGPLCVEICPRKALSYKKGGEK
jgi:Fe-S-cluster-containing hydrogenase component 2